jgi:hypothetical protein
VGVVFPAKRYVVVVDAKQAVVGNGDSMRVTCQILQDMFRTAERRLGVNDPWLPADGIEKGCEFLFVGERRAVSKENQLMSAECLLQTVRELAPKNAAEHFDRQKETGSRADPASVIGRWAASRHDAM